jgi:hypothetical protein
MLKLEGASREAWFEAMESKIWDLGSRGQLPATSPYCENAVLQPPVDGATVYFRCRF